MRLRTLCAVLRKMRDVGPMTIREVAEATRCEYNAAWHWVRVMRGEGVLGPEGTRDGSTLWGIAPAGTPVGDRYFRGVKPRRGLQQHRRQCQ